MRARLEGPEEPPEAALALEVGAGGLREVPSGRLAVVPSVREELLAEPDKVSLPEPVRRIALGLRYDKRTGTQVLDQTTTRLA